MGRRPILTRQQIITYLDRHMIEKELPVGGERFKWYMENPVRPTTKELSQVFKLERNWMAKLRKRYEQDL